MKVKLKITDLIPHRAPFLLVDEIDSYESGKWIIGKRHIKKDEDVFRGHFPEQAVYPGVLLLEGIAQTAGALAGLMGDTESLFYIAAVSKAKFIAPVYPDSHLVFKVSISKQKGDFFWFEGEAIHEDTAVVKAQIMAVRKSRD